LNSYVHALLNGMDLMAQGNSTEPGIRQELRCDALPVLVDEGEQNDDRERARMQSILAMIRQASSESAARTYKGTSSGKSMHFHVRSMFCLASIQVGMCHQADKERLTILNLRGKRETNDAAGEWEGIKDALYKLERDTTVASRLFRRSLDLLPITLKNVEVFAKAAAEKFGSQRDGDQYGTLMAGAWSLIHDIEATPDQAMALLNHYDWTDYMGHADHDEASSALSALMEARVRLVGGTEWCIHEIARVVVAGASSTDLSVEDADRLLQRHGIRVKDGYMLFSNRSESLPRLVAHTSYSTDIRGHLKRVPGATNYDNRPISIGASVAKCVAVPLEKCLPTEPLAPAGKDVAPPF
jgi:putative DNA primase/helicase